MKIISSLFLIFISILGFCEAIYEPDQLFVLFDAGETNALIPVIENLEAQQRNYNLLSFGTSQKLIEKFNHRIIPLHKIGIKEKIDSFWDRTQPLSPASLKAINDNIQPKSVLVGVASVIQAQCIEIFRQHPKTDLFAYRDNLNRSIPISDIVQSAIPCSDALRKSAVLFPSQMTADLYQDELYDRIVVGKPSLELLQEQVLLPQTRQNALQKVGLSEFSGRIVCWIGGYDEPGKTNYAKAVFLFKQCLDQCERSPEKIRVIVQLHPKAKEQNIQVEKTIIGEDERVLWPSETSRLSVAETLAISNLVATYQSSVGFDAVFCGKNTVYIVPEGDQSFKAPIELQAGFATRISCPLPLKVFPINHKNTLKQKLGIPSNSISNIIQEITKKV